MAMWMARFPLNLPIFPLLLALLAARPAAAQPLTMTAGLQLGSTYRTDCWQPIHLELRNDGDAEIHGVVVVPLSDPRAPATMVLPVSVPPRALVRATMWAYFPPPASEPSKNLGASA